MSDEPSKSLVTLLEELGLATSGQVLSVARHVRRLAGELPPLDSVWVDALAQARLLTPHQAAEINAGRGRSLRLGPYIVEKPLGENGFAAFYRARQSESQHNVHLAIVEKLHRPAADYEQPLAQLARASASIAHHAVCPVIAAGTSEGKVWAACEAAVGLPAAKWMVERGRFSPLAALHIAREIAAAMYGELERAGLWHGDLGVGSVLVSQTGNVQLVMPGLRACVRPYEGYTLADLQPEAFDTLAPERIADGAATSGSTELYAWGCVCWQLLTGRPPFAGGSSLAKLQAVHAAKLVDVRRLAPECPEILWRAIAACLAVDPAERPKSFAALCAMLGPSARSGSRDVARCLAGQTVWGGGTPRRRASRTRSKPLATAAVVLVAAACVGSWPLWRGKVWGSGTATHANSVASLKHVAVPERSAAIATVEKAARPFETKARRDTLVRPAGLSLPVESPGAIETDEVAARESTPQASARTRQAAERRRLILPSGRLLKLERLNVEPGQIVTGRDGARPRVQSPPGGLVISSDDVMFENIDFVAPRGTEKRPAAIVALRASNCTFVGCTFQAAANGAMSATAIEWTDGDDGQSTVGSELRLVDCTLCNMSAGIVCERTAGVTVDLTNTLHVESGPLVRLTHCPSLREAVQLNLNRCTLRGAAVVECRYQSIPEQPGQIAITAESSVFSPRESLLAFAGSGRPEAIVRSIEWSGQGSLLTPNCEVAAWRPNGRTSVLEALDESTVEVAGVVRSEVVFAGDVSADSKASRVTDWQVPLRSDDPPGIGPSLSGRSSQPAAE